MDAFTVRLIFPGVVGLAFQLVVIATGDFSSPVLPAYSALICVWAIIMLEYWKREEFKTALRLTTDSVVINFNSLLCKHFKIIFTDTINSY